jgi:hypothetical protein
MVQTVDRRRATRIVIPVAIKRRPGWYWLRDKKRGILAFDPVMI